MFVRSPIKAALIILCLAGVSAHASVQQLNSCHLEGKITISESTIVACDGELKFAPGTDITVEKDQVLVISAFRGVNYGERTTVHGMSGSELQVHSTLTATGKLDVDGGTVRLDYGSTDQKYTQDLNNIEDVEMWRAGVRVALLGTSNQPTAE